MSEQSFVAGHSHGGNFLDRLAAGLLHAMDHAFDADDLARRNGFLQKLDPRIKVAGLLILIVVAVAVKSLAVLGGLFLFAVVLALTSQVTLARLGKQVWLSVLAFTGMIALPAIFLVPGDAIAHMPYLGWAITMQGVRSAAFLTGRAETAATFALLLILTTSWPHILKALRVCRVPTILIVILGMTHRYIFILLQTAIQMSESRRSRMIGSLPPRERRRVATATAGVLFGKALHLSTEVHLAMLSRGYRGEVHLIDDFRTKPLDWAALAAFLTIAALALYLQA